MHRALICDGDSQILTRLTAMLTLLDFEVESYPDGGWALKQFLHASPDLVIWDCFAPTVHGIRMFETLKNDPKSSGVPYFLMCYRDMKDLPKHRGASGSS